jgi:hypothetical protein
MPRGATGKAPASVELATGVIARRLRPARDFGDDSAGQGGGRKLHVYLAMNNNFAFGGVDSMWVAGRSQ